MQLLWFALLCVALFLLAAFFFFSRRRLKGLFLALLLVLFPNTIALSAVALRFFSAVFGGFSIPAVVVLNLFLLVLWLKLNLAPLPTQRTAPLRLRILFAGRTIAYSGLAAMYLNAAFVPLSWPLLAAAGVGTGPLAVNVFFCAGAVFLLLFNGTLRMALTSHRLRVLGRLWLLFFWVPLVNIFVLWQAGRTAHDEYDYELYKKDLHLTRAHSDLCATQYPLVMVHGVLFRDLKYFNYWGRIPKELALYGARVYYGNQEAVGTIQRNAADLCREVDRVLAETGAEKVNIIAHSKGGLDARHAITALGLSGRVASLTTISTPHRGCRFVDKACRLPQWLFRFVAGIMDNIFRRLGDADPDFYTAIHQFQTADSEAFNRATPDVPGVYYQSYMTQMTNKKSDSLLGFTYSLIYPLEGDNDGLVSVPSARWGNFRQLFSSTGKRGISHGDIIDLKREDYPGFDVQEAFVSIVADLKAQGF